MATCCKQYRRFSPGWGRAPLIQQDIRELNWFRVLCHFRAPPGGTPKLQCLRQSVRGAAAQWISAFSISLTQPRGPFKVGGCANGLRIACGTGPAEGRGHHLLVTLINWKLESTSHQRVRSS